MTNQDPPVTINISGIPVAGVGGLGLVAMAVLISVVMPEAWWLMAGGVAGGCVLGAMLVLVRHGLSTRGPSGSDPKILFRTPATHETANRGVPPEGRRYRTPAAYSIR